MASDAAQAFRAQLQRIANESSARMELLNRQVERSNAEAKEKSAETLKSAGRTIALMNERRKQVEQAGGWETGRTFNKRDEDEDTFGFEDDEEARGDLAEYPPSPPEPPRAEPPPQPAPVVAPVADRGGRHARRPAPADDLDDDDFARRDWTSD